MALDVNDYIAQKLAQSSLSGSTGKTRLAALEEVNDGTVRIFDPKTLRSELPKDWVHGYDAEKGQGLASKGHGPLYKEDLADLCVEVRFDDRTQTLTKDGQLIPYTRLTEKFPEPTDEEYASLDKAKATIEARRGKTLEKWELKSWINRDKATALLNEVGLTYGYEIKVADGTREIDGRTVRNNQRSGDAKTFQTDHGPRARTTHFQNQTRSGMNLPDGRRENLQTGIIQGYNRTADDGKKEWTEHDWKADAGNPNEIRLHLLSEGIHTHDTDYMRQKEWSVDARLRAPLKEGFLEKSDRYIDVEGMLIPERALPEGDEFKTYRDRLDLGNDAPVKHKVYAVHPSGNTLMPAEAMATWKNDKGEMEFKNHFNSVFKKGTWDKEPAHVTNARYAGQPPVMIRYNGDMIVTPSEAEAIGRSEGQETKASDFSGGYVMAAKLDGRATKENRLKLLGKESTARAQPPTSHSLKVLATMSREEIAPQAITALKGNGLDHMIPAVVKRERDDIPVKPKVERDERGRDDRSASAGLAG